VADTNKLSYKDAVKQMVATSKTSAVKTVEIAQKPVVDGSPITSARPIGIHAAVKTAVLNEDSARLEAKLDFVLTEIATLSSQLNSKMSFLRQEVSEQ